MKRLLALVLASVLALGIVAACGETTEKTTTTTTPAVTTEGTTTTSTAPETNLTGTLEIWSFTSELQTHAIAFQKYNPDVVVNYTQISMTDGEYQNKVIAAATTDECPDVVGLEAAFVREWVESDLLANLNDLLPLAANLQTYQSTIDVGTFDGECRAFSYQSTPGAVFYRRSLATEYFGTDDPEEIQALMYSDGKSFDKFTEMAAVVKEKSGGNTFMVSSIGDFQNLFFANRTDPWIVDGAFVLDPMVEDLFDIAKTFRENGYESKATQWTEGWFAGMNDTLASADGTAQQIFCYFLPTWGLPYVLSSNGVDTAGDWGVVSGPMAYQWGGTWVGAMKNSPSLDLAKAFVSFVALNEEHLTNWATGVYTNEYLLAIDPDCGDLKQAAGDFVSSKLVVDKITASFDDSEMSAYLGGQNSYGGFAAAAPQVSAKLMQGSDDAIQRQITDPLANYAEGIMTKEEAIQSFKDLVASQFPDISFS